MMIIMKYANLSREIIYRVMKWDMLVRSRVPFISIYAICDPCKERKLRRNRILSFIIKILKLVYCKKANPDATMVET